MQLMFNGKPVYAINGGGVERLLETGRRNWRVGRRQADLSKGVSIHPFCGRIMDEIFRPD